MNLTDCTQQDLIELDRIAMANGWTEVHRMVYDRAIGV